MNKKRYLAGKVRPGTAAFARLEKRFGPVPSSEAVEASVVEEKPKKKTKKVARKKSED